MFLTVIIIFICILLCHLHCFNGCIFYIIVVSYYVCFKSKFVIFCSILELVVVSFNSLLQHFLNEQKMTSSKAAEKWAVAVALYWSM